MEVGIMKVIAIVNFKGGVGKTTLTWLLAQYVAYKRGKKVLVFDADAQMSLTISLSVDEARGTWHKNTNFSNWYEYNHIQKKRTILNALEAYDNYASGQSTHFDFVVDRNFIYEVSPNLYFVPSVTDLYWLELDVFNRGAMRNFISALLGKIQNSSKSPINPEIVFFDCPPNFTVLSYSILQNTSIILIPVNPDVFAATGVKIMLDGLKLRLEPWPNPTICVVMNKARTWRSSPTRETLQFLDQVEDVAVAEGVYVCNQYIPERADIRKSISFGGFPIEYEPYFASLWDEIAEQGGIQ